MVTEAASTEPRPRRPLSRERVLRAAVEVADQGGLGSLTMRNLARHLGVEAMSLYHHVANKEAVLDGLVDTVVAEIEATAGGFMVGDDPWKSALRRLILTARQVMLRHPWAPSVIETRTTISPILMRYFNAVLGILREGGFSYDLAHHAMHALGSRALGFTQELFEPDDETEADADISAVMADMAEELPYLVGMLAEVSHDDPDSTIGWCDDQTEFEFGLDLILDGLEPLRTGSEGKTAAQGP